MSEPPSNAPAAERAGPKWRQSLVPGMAVGATVLLAVLAAARRLGLYASAASSEGASEAALEGPWIWITSRALGAVALWALASEVVLGLALSTDHVSRALRPRVAKAAVLELHQLVGSVAIALTVAHAAVLLLGPGAPIDLFDLAVPGLMPYRTAVVAAGIVALYLLVAVQWSFSWRARLGPRWWRRLHGLSFVALALALGHGLVASSRAGADLLTYLVPATLVLTLLGYRLLERLRRRARA